MLSSAYGSPTSDRLLDPDAKPYFACKTVGEIRDTLASGPRDDRDEIVLRWLRQANRRDVWLFISWSDIEEAWDRIAHGLGRSRGVWERMRDRHRQHAIAHCR